MQIRLVKGLSLGIEYGISTCTPSFKSCNMYMYRTIHEHFPKHSSSPMFQEHIDLSHFKLMTCPCNIHNQHWVKCTQNNPFISLGSWAMTWAWFAWMGVYIYTHIYHCSLNLWSCFTYKKWTLFGFAWKQSEHSTLRTMHAYWVSLLHVSTFNHTIFKTLNLKNDLD